MRAADSSPAPTPLQQLIEGLPGQTATHIRLGAISQVVDAAILEGLLGADGGAKAYTQLAELSFVSQVGDQLIYRRGIREALLADWFATPDSKQAYRAASRRLLPLLEARLAKHSQAEPADELIALAYHTMGSDETAGLALVDTIYSRSVAFAQWGVADRLLTALAELTALLIPATQHWLAYFRADLRLAQHLDPEQRAAEFEQLANESHEDRLQALARLKHGQARMQSYDWSGALADFTASQRYFGSEANDLKLAEVLLSHGAAYEGLARSAGGLSIAEGADWGLGRVRLRWRSLPFDLFRQLIDRWPWFASIYLYLGTRLGPLGLWLTALYVGSRYQDWIVARLLIKAIDWHRRAERLSRQLGQQPEHAEAVERLARLYHQLGHQRASRRELAALFANPWVARNPYRLAQALCVQGEIKLALSQWSEARQALTAGLKTFQSMAAEAWIGRAALALGRLHRVTGEQDQAEVDFAAAIDAFQQVGDGLSSTQAATALDELMERPTVPSAARRVAQQSVARLHQRQYLERFPDEIRRRFRLPAVIAGIVVWLFAFVIAILSSVIMAGVSADLSLKMFGWNLSTLVAMLLTPLVLIWGFQIAYTLVGATCFAWTIPLAAIVQAHPRLFTWTQSNLMQERADQGPTTTVWFTAAHLISRKTSLTETPIALLSEVTLATPSSQVSVRGTVDHFGSLTRLVERQIEPGRQKKFNTTILSRRWTLLLLACCLAFGVFGRLSLDAQTGLPGGVTDFHFTFEFECDSPDCEPASTPTPDPTEIAPAPETSEPVATPLASAFLRVNLALLLAFPSVTITRVVIQRRRAKAALLAIYAAHRPPTAPNGLASA
jgi:hypothetical protein